MFKAKKKNVLKLGYQVTLGSRVLAIGSTDEGEIVEEFNPVTILTKLFPSLLTLRANKLERFTAPKNKPSLIIRK